MGLNIGSNVIVDLIKISTKLQDKIGSDTEGVIQELILIDGVDYCVVKIIRNCTKLPLIIEVPIDAVFEI